MISVTGSDVYSALRKSLANAWPSALLALAVPYSSTRSCGWARCAAVVAASAAVTLSCASFWSPATLKVTSAVRPSAAIRSRLATSSGDWTSLTVGIACRRGTRSLTAATNAGSPNRTAPLPWTSTCSSAVWGRRLRRPGCPFPTGRSPSAYRSDEPVRRSYRSRRPQRRSKASQQSRFDDAEHSSYPQRPPDLAHLYQGPSSYPGRFRQHQLRSSAVSRALPWRTTDLSSVRPCSPRSSTTATASSSASSSIRTPAERSVANLTWSYAAFLSAAAAR